MIHTTLQELQARIEAGHLKPEQKAELVQLLSTLRSEIQGLEPGHRDEAVSITQFTSASAHEATRTAKNPELLEISLKGLTSSVEGFEESHPRLVQIVNSISVTLSNLGI